MATRGWALTGNPGTDPMNNFLGTTDSQPLIIKTSGTERTRVLANGNVGIGTPAPVAPLHVVSDSSESNAPSVLIESTSTNLRSPRLGFVDTALGPDTTAPVWYVDNYGDNFRIFRQPNIYTPGSAFLQITNEGEVKVTGDVILSGADCAEEFDVSGSELPEPGTVVVIDEGGTLRECRNAYDKKVAGVVSGAGPYKHAIILDNRSESKRRVAVALVGKVYCKVDAQYSPIEIGDLLTTSPSSGYAMKATEPLKAFGSIIGKALTTFDRGQGLIPILVALQ